ncbi:MAG: hypothetical protein NT113_11225, partial [Hyphomicrobiales bacterium]|nr:hypothetical protein [Hyphomicrobiales bacterium]
MANNSKKAKDPTEVALSAIQEALNIDGPRESNLRGDAPPLTNPMDLDDARFDSRVSADRPAFETTDESRFGRRAANDDRETIGQILQA